MLLALSVVITESLSILYPAVLEHVFHHFSEMPRRVDTHTHFTKDSATVG